MTDLTSMAKDTITKLKHKNRPDKISAMYKTKGPSTIYKMYAQSKTKIGKKLDIQL